MFRQEIESLGTADIPRVEKAQQEIVDIARQQMLKEAPRSALWNN
jgi:flagellar motor switch protein FliG